MHEYSDLSIIMINRRLVIATYGLTSSIPSSVAGIVVLGIVMSASDNIITWTVGVPPPSPAATACYSSSVEIRLVDCRLKPAIVFSKFCCNVSILAFS